MPIPMFAIDLPTPTAIFSPPSWAALNDSSPTQHGACPSRSTLAKGVAKRVLRTHLGTGLVEAIQERNAVRFNERARSVRSSIGSQSSSAASRSTSSTGSLLTSPNTNKPHRISSSVRIGLVHLASPASVVVNQAMSPRRASWPKTFHSVINAPQYHFRVKLPRHEPFDLTQVTCSDQAFA